MTPAVTCAATAPSGGPSGAAPLTPDDLAARLDPLIHPTCTGLVVAVSGGPDSICLMHLVATLRDRFPHPVEVATVDHGLRAAAATEARAVEVEATRLGLRAHRLRCDGPRPSRGIQAWARAARYGLLTDLCHRRGASHLLTAHTLDDQAETLLLRLSRGSGPAGLAGMRPLVARGGILHARPLLDVTKARLVATCQQHGWVHADDPSNRDPRFARSRWRSLMPVLAGEGLDAARLGRLAGRLARADAALQVAADQLVAAAQLDRMGSTRRFDARLLAAAPLELLVRAIGGIVQQGDNAATLRLERLERLAGALQQAAVLGTSVKRTLHGAVLSFDGRRVLEVRPEDVRRRGARGTDRPCVDHVGDV